MGQNGESLGRNELRMSPLERVFERKLQHGDSRKRQSGDVGENTVSQSFEARLHYSASGRGDVWQPEYEEVVYKHHDVGGLHDTYVDVSFADDAPYQVQWQASPIAEPESKKMDYSQQGQASLEQVKASDSPPPVSNDGEDACAAGLASVYNKLSLLDRHLFIWIIVVMAVAILVGYYHPEVKQHLEVAKVDLVPLPIAIGLWVMLYPVLCKVRYERLGQMLKGKELRSNLLLSFFLNWIVGPALMAALAWATLPDLPTYRTGVILIGIARCIAMVLIWNDVAKGDAEFCAVLVAFNTILQILLFVPFSTFYLRVVSGSDAVDVSVRAVTSSVFFFLGIPFAAGLVTRLLLRSWKGEKWYDAKFVPFVAPLALVGLLCTIFIMFSVQAHEIISNIGSVCRVVVPLLLYYMIMFFTAGAVCRRMKLPYEQLVTQSFTAASNNFELAIAVAIGIFGIDSHEALAATIGPLIEVPVSLGVVYLTLHLRRRNIF